jgi:hypothetical protein
MTQVIVDPVTLTHLRNLSQPVELCDASGRVLGYYVPAVGEPATPKLLPRITEKELDGRQQERGGRPLAAILEDLEKRA